jgi:hypothetical protein
MQLSNRGNSPARPAVRKFESMSSRQNLPVSDKSSAVDSGMFTLHHDQIPLPVKCRRCSFTCNINAQLELHNRTCNGVRKRKPGRFNCMHCNMTTDRKNILLWHVAHHEGEHEVCYHMCSGCQFATMLDEEMTAHELERHAGSKALSISVTEKVTYLQNILKCPLCSYGLMWGSIYFGHLRKEHHLSGLAEYLEKTYSDSSCPRTIQFPKHLLNADAGGDSAAGSSIVSRVDNAPVEICKFHCEYCEFSTNDNVGYLDHQKSHVIRCDKISDVSNRCAGEKNDYVTKYFCPSCAFTSVVEEQFRLHMDDHVKYDQLDDGFMCGICAYKCPSHSRVREHMKSFHLNIPDGKIVKIGSNGKKSDSSNKKKVGGGKTKNNARPKSAKGKQACSDVRSTAYEKDSNGSAYSRSSRNSSCSTSQLSQKQNIRDVIDTFERELPSVQVFARDMKCPVCDFTNRFRVNVMRHLKMHREHARRPSQTTEPLVESRLSFGLWKPLNNDQSVNCSGARDSGRLDRANDALMNSGMTTGINDLEAGQPHLRQELMEHAVPRSAAAAEMDSDKKIRHPSSSGVQYFRCEVCEDRFNTKANLERHITERHQGPYVCHLCGQLMWQKGSVRKHYTADHPGAPVMYEVIRREIGDDSGTEQSQAAVEKKVARIQG